MMRASITRRASLALAILTSAGLFAACAQAAPQQQSEAPGAPTSSAAAPTGTGGAATQSAQSAAPVEQQSASPSSIGAGTFTTQNGSASLSLPEGWSGTDSSFLLSGPAPDDVWVNLLDLEGAGARVTYFDGLEAGPSWQAPAGTWGAVDARPLTGTRVAQSFWSVEEGRYIPRVALTQVSQELGTAVAPGDVTTTVGFERGDNSYVLQADFTDASGITPSFATEAEAVTFLRSPEAVATLEVIASVEITGIDGNTLP